MKKLSIITVLTILFFGLVGCNTSPSSNGGESDDKVFLNLGSTSQTSGSYAYFVSIAEEINKGSNGEIQVSVVETGASVDNVQRLRKGEIDFALGTESINFSAYKGTGAWEKDGPFEKLRGMIVYFAPPQPIVVTNDSGIEQVTDLEGKPFFPGFVGSASETATMEILKELGISPDYVQGSLNDGVKALKDRQSIGIVKTGIGVKPDPTIIDINSSVPLTIVGYTPEQVKKIENLGYSTKVIPSGNYPNQDEDVVAHTIALTLTTTSDLSEDVVYKLMEHIIPNRDAHAEVYSPVKDLDYIETTLEGQAIPLHAGAVKYLQDQGVEVPEHLIPPEYKD